MYLIMFLCSILCFLTCVFSVLCFLVQMSPTKHAAPKRSSSKHARTDSDNFRSAEVDMKYNECYKDKTIIMERIVQMESLKDSFKPEVFKDRTWKKLLNSSGVMYLEIIKEFFSNASVEENHINYWVRHKESVINRESIQDFLEVRPPS